MERSPPKAALILRPQPSHALSIKAGNLTRTRRAPAQDWAKTRLEASPRHQEWVTVSHGSRRVQCFIVYPQVSKRADAVLVVHEIFGLSDWARELADEVAAAGYIAIVPDLLSGSGPNGGGSDAYPDQDARVRAVSMLPPEQVASDLDAAETYVSRLPACTGRVVVAGFCWGGGQAFHFATVNHRIRAAFVFYGVGPDTAAEASQIRCPVYGSYGGSDARVSSTVPATAALMRRVGKKYQAVIYPGAGHGFMRAGEAPDATPANHHARQEAWTRWMRLMRRL